MNNDIPFARNAPLHYMITVFVLCLGLSGLSPTNRQQWLAESIAIAALALCIAFGYRWYRFSNLSYLLMLLFIVLHLYAAHFTYEGTPFDHWLKHAFHTKRSYYDRVVHFFFGLSFAFPFRELLKNKGKIAGSWTFTLALLAILGCSAIFEIIEMLAASVAGKGGEAKFIGAQGDVFDSQKDMGLAGLGGLLTVGMLAWVDWRKGKI
ncbi:DUF2238 domain-containing protein [Paenibacillus rhizovicinus]|uniref:DUF2238 domain-containing protein n=1 Tax=Paenibacillus rhizovicinus TaxID=2704463 RepID=A0A6C0NVJ0_9BACL|nr:DUF2238 domain-containing protein [Paenibacillus rhizovicinus]QHW30131.1 DUF2238 domain-containing protein [Paenibacillus rhizovicinus]